VTGLVLAGKPDCRLEVAGRPLAAWVVAALKGVSGMRRVAVVGAGDWPGALAVEPGGSIVENLRRGVAALGSAEGWPPGGSPGAWAGEEMVIAAGDAPLLTPGAVERFAAACRAAGADIGYPVVPRAACEARFPGVRRTYVRLREGEFTGGNCFFLTPAAVEPAVHWLDRVYRARKRPLRLARLLGLGLVLRLALGRASMREAERVAGRLLGLRARGIVCADDPEIGVDVDKPADLELVRRLLAG
jgi:CTP:molybdopterin cytidylyltransferase MocA